MTNVLIQYRTNTDYHNEGYFHGDFVYDVQKLRNLLESGDCQYSEDEIKKILHIIDRNFVGYDLHMHDKYSFYDTSWEQNEVMAADQNNFDYTITIYLNA